MRGGRMGGMGVGSALVVLVFAVLCLTIFALISLTTATNDMAMADAAVSAAENYYRADTMAEEILAVILESDTIPDTVRGVEIMMGVDISGRRVAYNCPVSDSKELCVEVLISEDSYSILKWKMQDTGIWEIESGPSVWSGE